MRSRSTHASVRGWGAGPVFLLCTAVLLCTAATGSTHADVLVVASNQIHTIDTASGETLKRLELGEVIRDLEFSADGKTIYAASSGGKVHPGGVLEIDAKTLELRRRLTAEPVRSLQLSADARTLFALDWSVDRSDPRAPTASPFRLRRIALTASGQVAAGAAAAGAAPDTLSPKVYDFLVAPDGEHVYCLNLATDTLQVHDASGKLLDRIPVGRNPKTDPQAPMAATAPLKATPDGRLVCLKNGARGEIVLVDLKNQSTEVLKVPHGMQVRDYLVTADHKLILASIRHVYLYDLDARRELRATPVPYVATRIALSRDGTEIFLAGGSRKPGTKKSAIQVLNAETLESSRVIESAVSPWAMGVLPASN